MPPERWPGRVWDTASWYVWLLLPFTLSALAVALLVLPLQPARWPWFVWLLAAPAMYVCWLFIQLGFMALTTRAYGRRHPKPSRAVIPTNGPTLSTFDKGLVTVALCYRRAKIVEALPLASQLPWLRAPLAWHAYAPSVHIGRSLTNLGWVYDPDLTVIGNDVVIGAGATITAHSVAAQPDGDSAYVSAAVEIGDRVTIGGNARIDLGCVIGPDATIEPCAWLPPFSRVGPGEVWGGNPAMCRSPLGKPLPAMVHDIAPADQEEVRALLLDVLQIGPEEAPSELNEDTCPAWDSLGRLAIAAALFDRYGIEVGGAEVANLRSEEDVAALLARPVPMDPPRRESAAGDVDWDVALLPLEDSGSATRMIAERFAQAQPGAQRLRVAIAASFTAEPLATTLTLWVRAFGFELECEFAGFDQLEQVLLDPNGPFARNTEGVNVVLTRIEDLVPADGGDALARLNAILHALERTASQPHRGELLAGSLPPAVSVFSGVDAATVDEVRHAWRAGIEELAGVELFDFAGCVERLGVEASRSTEGEVLNRAPYSARLYQELAIALVRHVHGARRAPAKVVVLDCDGTLWGGVVGELGPAGVALGPDGEGRAFQLLQRHLKRLKDRGVLLAVVSKNEENDVLEMFEGHPEMILRPDDVAAWKVSWGPKSAAIAELADELNLGLDSFVLLDDSPRERHEVKMALPAVHVIPLPDDPTRYVDTLARLWLFDGAQLTAEDQARTELVREENQRQQAMRSAGTLQDFLRDLHLRVEVRSPWGAEWGRVAQLTQKTNQFNLSLRRRSLAEVQAFAGTVLILRAADRFGDYGLVGVAMLSPRGVICEIDTLLMSCRALGRGVEDAFLHVIAATALESGAEKLVAPYVAGQRNRQVLDFLRRCSFRETAADSWELPLSPLPPLPEHVALDWERQEVAAAVR